MAQRQVNRGDTAGALLRLKGIIDQTDRLTEMLEEGGIRQSGAPSGSLAARDQSEHGHLASEPAAQRAHRTGVSAPGIDNGSSALYEPY